MRKHWEGHSALKQKGISGTDKEIGREVDLGGLLIEVDWDTKRRLKEWKLSCPSGILQWGDVIAVASMRQNEIYLFNKNGHLLHTLSHPILNTPHSMAVTRNDTLLVASTGVDGILEFTRKGECIWKWFAFEHGYELDQYGRKRVLNTQGNTEHRNIDYPTLYQTTHVNSIIQHQSEDNIILATLFHQGAIIAVDKKTGVPTTLVAGLDNPHSIRTCGDGYVASDTKKGRIVLLNENLKERGSFQVGSNWLQDAVVLSSGNFLAVRSDEHDIVEVDYKTKKIISTFSYPKNWRAYQAEEIY